MDINDGTKTIQTFIFLDIESTNVSRFDKPKITEIAMTAVHRKELLNLYRCSQGESLSRNTNRIPKLPRITDTVTLCINPGRRISPTASEISGLDNLSLEASCKRKFDETDATLLSIFIARQIGPVCLVAHNGFSFDFPLLKTELDQLKVSFEHLKLLCGDTYCAFKELDEQQSERQVESFLSEHAEDGPRYPAKRRRHVARCLFLTSNDNDGTMQSEPPITQDSVSIPEPTLLVELASFPTPPRDPPDVTWREVTSKTTTNEGDVVTSGDKSRYTSDMGCSNSSSGLSKSDNHDRTVPDLETPANEHRDISLQTETTSTNSMEVIGSLISTAETHSKRGVCYNAISGSAVLGSSIVEKMTPARDGIGASSADRTSCKNDDHDAAVTSGGDSCPDPAEYGECNITSHGFTDHRTIPRHSVIAGRDHTVQESQGLHSETAPSPLSPVISDSDISTAMHADKNTQSSQDPLAFLSQFKFKRRIHPAAPVRDQPVKNSQAPVMSTPTPKEGTVHDQDKSPVQPEGGYIQVRNTLIVSQFKRTPVPITPPRSPGCNGSRNGSVTKWKRYYDLQGVYEHVFPGAPGFTAHQAATDVNTLIAIFIANADQLVQYFDSRTIPFEKIEPYY